MASDRATGAWQTSVLSGGNTVPWALLFLTVHCAVWTLYAVRTNHGALHPDMLEAFSWGREFQLGYYKHPPLWAWLAGAWFEVFPRSNWAFYLLATLNSGIGVLGVWQLTGLFTRGDFRFCATALLVLLPAYTVQGHQYNANFMLVSLWPWTAYFFVRSMESRRIRDAVWLGTLAAAGMLSKYYSALLLLSCFAASFVHTGWRQYYRSAAPYVAAATCALLLAPHVWWLVVNDFPTFKYVETRTEYSDARVIFSFITFNLGAFCLNLMGGGLVFLARPRKAAEADEREKAAPLTPDDWWLFLILALGPFCLTLLSAVFGHFRISSNFASPIFFLIPLLLIQLLRPSPERLRPLAIAAAIILYAGAPVLAPEILELSGTMRHTAPEPVIETAREAEAIWSQNTELPLRIVAGSTGLAKGLAFYGHGEISNFIHFDRAQAPWITDDMLARSGVLIVCLAKDEACRQKAAELSASARETEIDFKAGDGPPVQVAITVALPTTVDQQPSVVAKAGAKQPVSAQRPPICGEAHHAPLSGHLALCAGQRSHPGGHS
jgi:hypothetical protein